MKEDKTEVLEKKHTPELNVVKTEILKGLDSPTLSKEERKEGQDLIAKIDEIIGKRTVKVEALMDTPVDGKMFSKGQQGHVSEQQFAALAARLKRVTVIALMGALLLIGGTVQGQQYTWNYLTFTNGTSLNGGTNNVKGGAAGTGGATNDYTSGALMLNPITVTKYDSFALQITFTNDNPLATSNVLFYCDWSLDATNWDVYGAFSKATAAGSVTVIVTNPPVFNVGYFRIRACVNTNGGAVTNLAIRYGLKPRRLGAVTPAAVPGGGPLQMVQGKSWPDPNQPSTWPRPIAVATPTRIEGGWVYFQNPNHPWDSSLKRVPVGLYYPSGVFN